MTRSPKFLLPIIASVALGALASAGCSGGSSSASPPPSCTSKPSSCGTQKTCWPVDATGKFSCLPQGTAQQGDPCTLYLDHATCAAGLFCAVVSGTSKGSCEPFCGPSAPCSGGMNCEMLALQGTSTAIDVCAPPSTPANDAGVSDGGKSEGGVSEGGKSEGGKSEGGKSEGGVSDAGAE